MVKYVLMCIWHNCRNPRIERSNYCESHAKLAAIEKQEIEEAMAKIAAKKKETAK